MEFAFDCACSPAVYIANRILEFATQASARQLPAVKIRLSSSNEVSPSGQPRCLNKCAARNLVLPGKLIVQPHAASAVEVERKLIRVRTLIDRLHFVVSLVLNPSLNDVGSKHIPPEEEVMVSVERVECCFKR